MDVWFPEPTTKDDTHAALGEGTVSWLARSTVPRAAGYRDLLNRNLSQLPAGCRKGIHDHLRAEEHHQDGFFELIVGRTLQELDAEIVCEPRGLRGGRRPDFVASFPDGTVLVEAVRPVLDKALSAVVGLEAPVTKLIEEHVPPGWAADIRALPRIGPNESRRHIKAFLRREMNIAPPTHDGDEVDIRGRVGRDELRIVLYPQSRHGLSATTKIAMYYAVAYFPDDKPALRAAVRRKYAQLKDLGSPALVALNMTSTTTRREDLDEALFGVAVSQRNRRGDEVGRYFQADGLFAGGIGEPTISGVLAFPEVGMLRGADPVLYAHPRFGAAFPRALEDLETRRMPRTSTGVRVRRARRTDVLANLGFPAEN